MTAQIGDKVTVRGVEMTIDRVHPCGTIDVVDAHGDYFRVSGLAHSLGAHDVAERVRTRAVRVRLQCNECGRKFSVSANGSGGECPKCGGTDWEVL